MKHIQTFESFINEAKEELKRITNQAQIKKFLDDYYFYLTADNLGNFDESAKPLTQFTFDSNDGTHFFSIFVDNNGNGILIGDPYDGNPMATQDIALVYDFTGGEKEAKKLIDKYRKHKYK